MGKMKHFRPGGHRCIERWAPSVESGAGCPAGLCILVRSGGGEGSWGVDIGNVCVGVGGGGRPNVHSSIIITVTVTNERSMPVCVRLIYVILLY